MSSNKKPTAVAIGAALAGGLVLSGSAFAMSSLAQGYMLSSSTGHVAPEGSCGGDHKAGMKAGEGSCGMEKMDTDKDGRISRAEFAAAHDGKDDKFGAHDPNGDGFISAEEMKAHHDAGRGGKAAMEGKCGEGKCGSM
jgi:uncharacterized low-complexity protein